MKAVILAGGYGTRISEETQFKPKPMIEIGGMPLLWHIMKIYSHNSINEFVVCLGYKGYVIKEYFANYFMHRSDLTIDLKNNDLTIHNNFAEPWSITLVDTGLHTQTGGRLKRIYDYVKNEEAFCFTYGDGVADIDIGKLIDFHRSQGTLATITAVQPPGRYGALILDKTRVLEFQEKPPGDNSWINGGFFVLSPKVINRYIRDDQTYWELEPLENLARDGELSAFFHKGFWRPMDTLRDKNALEELWQSDQCPWRIWDDPGS